MKTLELRALVLGLSCALACGSAEGEGESNAASTESESSGSSESESSTETESGSETGESETGSETGEPEAPRPVLSSPAEAEDLDPDPDRVRIELSAAPFDYEVDGEPVEGWAYNGQIPGPTIRLKRGDTLTVNFTNELDNPTTVHWHGLHVPFEMDGVAWMGAPVLPGEQFEYSFTVDQAGTYWYHPHVDTDRQLDLGLYGAIVVEDPDEPLVDRELVVLFDSWGEFEADNDQDGGHHGLDGSQLEWTANGLVDPVFPATAGERVRVRTINVANAGYVELEWPQMRQIASDQGLLPELEQPASVVLAPSDRADGEWLMSAGFEVLALPHSLLGVPTFGETERLFEVVVEDEGPAPDPLDWPFSGELPTPDPGWTDIIYVFHGDPHTGKWTINGELFPDITIETLPRDEWAVIELRNISQTAHPFHLHGMAFEVLSVDGEVPEFRVIEDSFDVAPYSIVRLGLLPDNVGDWMAHCHILPHVEGGMMTVLRVDP